MSPLLTDLYQLTMAFGYWKLGIHERKAVFNQIYRQQPFASEYSIACGLANAVEFLQDWHFAAEDLTYLEGLLAPNGAPLFTHDFLDYLGDLRFSCDVDAIPEGMLVFPHEPLLRITGPLLQGQLIESALLNIINFQTLIATKASRVCLAAEGDAVLEFGLRRAQGPDGALSASRAAYIGGVAATSNVLAGKKFDIPVSGTHAHSWVTAFADELSAFMAYAEVMPHNCVLLVDTYNTLQGVRHAIEVGKKLREKGAELRGIRLDSGNLAELSAAARRSLDEAGFSQVKIIASNSLDEHSIKRFKEKNAAISVWGVGTSLVTGYDHPALDGVYKLAAMQDAEGRWEYKLKLSEQTAKVSNPGILQVRRFVKNNAEVMDIIYDLETGIPAQNPEAISIEAPHHQMAAQPSDAYFDLLQPVFRCGKYVGASESIHVIRARAMQQVKQFLASHHSAEYPVGLEGQLHQLKQQLINKYSS